MVRVATAIVVAGAFLLAEGFAFKIGNPVAAGDFQFKAAAFVFRAEGCPESAKLQITSTAEGIVKGARKSLPLTVMNSSKPGVFAVFQGWEKEGDWVVNLKGTCGNESAGAIVPMGPKGFIRESVKLFSRPATKEEIETSLKAMVEGGKR